MFKRKNIENITTFHLKIIIFTGLKNFSIYHRCVFLQVMFCDHFLTFLKLNHFYFVVTMCDLLVHDVE